MKRSHPWQSLCKSEKSAFCSASGSSKWHPRPPTLVHVSVSLLSALQLSLSLCCNINLTWEFKQSRKVHKYLPNWNSLLDEHVGKRCTALKNNLFFHKALSWPDNDIDELMLANPLAPESWFVLIWKGAFFSTAYLPPLRSSPRGRTRFWVSLKWRNGAHVKWKMHLSGHDHTCRTLG